MATQKITTNQAKMTQASNELAQIHTGLNGDIKKMGEMVAGVKNIWLGEASEAYVKNYQKREPDLKALANAANNCAQILADITKNYARTDSEAMDTVKNLMGGR